MSTEVKALYAGSFDPPTNGHEWVIKKGARLFPHLEVQVGLNPGKNYMFSAAERIALIEKITAPLGNVAVSSLDEGFTIEYAYDNNFTHLLKGIRNAVDLEYEKNQDYASQLYLGRLIERDHLEGRLGLDEYPEIDPVTFYSPPHLQTVSSSFIRGLTRVKGWEEIAHNFVPTPVFNALIEKQLGDSSMD